MNGPNPMNQGSPFPFVFFTNPQPSYAPPANRWQERPPSRVEVALRFLRDLTFKEMKQVAVGFSMTGAVEPVEIDGLTLTNAEEGARNAACDMLRLYFNGELPATAAEELEVGIVEDERKGAKSFRDKALPPGGRTVRCACLDRGADPRGCSLCAGTGLIRVYSVES